MAFFKKLFNKKDDTNAPKPSQAGAPLPSDPVEDITLEAMAKDSATVNFMKDALKDQGLEPAEILKNNLDKLLPRLKSGSVENATNMKVNMEVNGETKEFDLPESAHMVGIDLKPDFTCTFVLDMENSYQFVTKGQLEASGMNKQELLQTACTNFMQQYANKIQLVNMDLGNVKMIRTDGNTEACTFLFNDIWQAIMQQMGFENLYLIMPLQDVVLIWNEISDEHLEDLIQRISQVVANNPHSKRISNHLFEYNGSGFDAVRQIFPE